MEDLSNYRKSYEKSEINENEIPNNPIELFKKWFHEVDGTNDDETNAMTVSTFGIDGFPKSRVVLLKQFDEKGFVFYTNYDSEKGKAIAVNPHVCLSFFWQKAERQVIIKGTADKVPESQSDDYFNSRPDGSKLGAIVSNQSEVIPSREILEEKLQQSKKEYEGATIPRPENWGGYLVKPIEIEFWQGRANRLHDRIRFKMKDEYSWKSERLSP